jgi:hypothetical protein
MNGNDHDTADGSGKNNAKSGTVHNAGGGNKKDQTSDVGGKKKSPNALPGDTTSSAVSSNDSGRKKSPDSVAGATTSSAISSNNSGRKKSPNSVASAITSSAISRNTSGRKKSPDSVAGATTSSAVSSNNSGRKKSLDLVAGATTSSAISSNKSGKKKSPNLVAGADMESAPQTSTSFPVGPCLLGKHCFAPTHELCKKCPGCGNDIHVLCGHVLEQMEGSKVNGEMKWYPADSALCLACDPKNAGSDKNFSG